MAFKMVTTLRAKRVKDALIWKVVLGNLAQQFDTKIDNTVLYYMMRLPVELNLMNLKSS